MKITLVSPSTQLNISSQTILINVTNLEEINRKSITSYLLKYHKIQDQPLPANYVTCHPKNYYVDTLLAKDYSLHFQEDDEAPNQSTQRNIKLVELPLTLEIVYADPNFAIGSFTDINLKLFQILEKIGEGTFAQVFLIQTKYNRQLYCLKRINKAECHQNGSLAMIKTQFQALQLSSRWKVKLYFCFEDPKYVYYILDYCPFGDLYSIIKSNKKLEESQRITLNQRYSIWIQIAFGIVSMHQRGLIYRDLKPENILINQCGEVKICDFGFVSKFQHGQKLQDICGSYEYIAPEMLKKEGYDKSLDFYCLGLLFYELLVGSNPFEGITPENVHQMKTRVINFDKKILTPVVKDLLKKLMREKPEDRIGYKSSLDLFKHDFFKENQELVVRIVQKKITPPKNLKYTPPRIVELRKELDKKMSYVFDKEYYNHLCPTFDVTEGIGPKFNFNH